MDEVRAERVPVWQRPAPKPMYASAVAKRLVDMANTVAPGTWVSYGDLADAYVVRHGENMVARGVASALSLNPPETYVAERAALDPQPLVNEWYVPWHRIRLADGRVIARTYGLLNSDDFVNRMFVHEGGVLRHGAATDGCRFPLLATVRSGTPVDSPARDLSDEQKARLAARARQREERLGRDLR